jgi:tetratricopeptide (TPR) repeat protein
MSRRRPQFFGGNRQVAQRTTTSTNRSANSNPSEDELINLSEVTEQAHDFYQKHQKTILGVLFGVVGLLGAYFLYKNLYLAPREKSAVEAMYQAENMFAKDSFAAALTNPGGGADGFEAIIDNYSGTKAANSAKYYAGICNLNLGKFQEAIDYLEDYSACDDITPTMKFGALGDAYAENGDLSKAESFYSKAANASKNEFLSPIYLNKLGLLNFKNGKNDEALKIFQKIKDEYPLSNEARDAEKFLLRLGK